MIKNDYRDNRIITFFFIGGKVQVCANYSSFSLFKRHHNYFPFALVFERVFDKQIL